MMKVTAKEQDVVPTFQPVKVVFVLETQAELDALGCCFNSGIVMDALAKVGGAETDWYDVYGALKGVGAGLTKTLMFNRILRKN